MLTGQIALSSAATAQTVETFEGAVSIPPATTLVDPQANFRSNFNFGPSGVNFTIRTPDFVGDSGGSPWYDVLNGTSFGVIQATNNTAKNSGNDGLGISLTAAELLASGVAVNDTITYSFLYAPGYNYDA